MKITSLLSTTILAMSTAAFASSDEAVDGVVDQLLSQGYDAIAAADGGDGKTVIHALRGDQSRTIELSADGKSIEKDLTETSRNNTSDDDNSVSSNSRSSNAADFSGAPSSAPTYAPAPADEGDEIPGAKDEDFDEDGTYTFGEGDEQITITIWNSSSEDSGDSDDFGDF